MPPPATTARGPRSGVRDASPRRPPQKPPRRCRSDPAGLEARDPVGRHRRFLRRCEAEEHLHAVDDQIGSGHPAASAICFASPGPAENPPPTNPLRTLVTEKTSPSAPKIACCASSMCATCRCGSARPRRRRRARFRPDRSRSASRRARPQPCFPRLSTRAGRPAGSSGSGDRPLPSARACGSTASPRRGSRRRPPASTGSAARGRRAAGEPRARGAQLAPETRTRAVTTRWCRAARSPRSRAPARRADPTSRYCSGARAAATAARAGAAARPSSSE